VPGQPKDEHDRLMATLPPAELLPAAPTTYRRWWNSSWYSVEEGGQRKAGEWTSADDRRLRDLVDHAHKLGYWIRFYTLDGFAPAGADTITASGQITQATSDGTGPAVNNPSLNDVQDSQAYTLLLTFSGSITSPGLYSTTGGTLPGASLLFSVPSAPSTESSF